MHQFRRFVQEQMDARSWTAADLSRRSGLSRQLLSNLLTDGRERLPQMPKDRTLRALAEAFSLPVETITAQAAQAVGVQITEVPRVDLTSLSSELLLDELRRRLRSVDEAQEQGQEASGEVDGGQGGESGAPIGTVTPLPPPPTPEPEPDWINDQQSYAARRVDPSRRNPYFLDDPDE